MAKPPGAGNKERGQAAIGMGPDSMQHRVVEYTRILVELNSNPVAVVLIG